MGTPSLGVTPHGLVLPRTALVGLLGRQKALPAFFREREGPWLSCAVLPTPLSLAPDGSHLGALGSPGAALPAPTPAGRSARLTSPRPASDPLRPAWRQCTELLELRPVGADLTCSIRLSGSLDRFKGLKPTTILLSRGISDAESSGRAGQGWQRKGRLRSVVWARTKPPPAE